MTTLDLVKDYYFLCIYKSKLSDIINECIENIILLNQIYQIFIFKLSNQTKEREIFWEDGEQLQALLDLVMENFETM